MALDIQPATLLNTTPGRLLDDYIAALNWLEEYANSQLRTEAYRAHCCMESCRHLWLAQNWPAICKLLQLPDVRQVLLRRNDARYASEQIDIFSKFLEQEDGVAKALCLTVVGLGHDLLYQTRKAFDFYKQSLLLFSQSGTHEKAELAWLHHTIADSNRGLGRSLEALTGYHTALSMYEDVQDPFSAAVLLCDIASQEANLGQFENARNHFQESLNRFENFPTEQHKDEQARAHHDYGLFLLNQLELDAARSHLLKGMRLFRIINNHKLIAWTYASLGHIMVHKQRFLSAQILYEAALSYFRQHHIDSGIAWTAYSLGRAACRLGNFALARQAHWEQVTSNLAESPMVMVAAIEGFAHTAVGEKDFQLAVILFGAAERWRDEISYPHSPATQVAYQQSIITMRDVLKPSIYQTLWNQGRAMSLNEAIALISKYAISADLEMVDSSYPQQEYQKPA